MLEMHSDWFDNLKSFLSAVVDCEQGALASIFSILMALALQVPEHLN